MSGPLGSGGGALAWAVVLVGLAGRWALFGGLEPWVWGEELLGADVLLHVPHMAILHLPS